MWYLRTLIEGRYWDEVDVWAFSGELEHSASGAHTILGLVLYLVQLEDHWMSGHSADSK